VLADGVTRDFEKLAAVVYKNNKGDGFFRRQRKDLFFMIFLGTPVVVPDRRSCNSLITKEWAIQDLNL
jgi:hypothetical protein